MRGDLVSSTGPVEFTAGKVLRSNFSFWKDVNHDTCDSKGFVVDAPLNLHIYIEFRFNLAFSAFPSVAPRLK